jgi:hypothetical protein
LNFRFSIWNCITKYGMRNKLNKQGEHLIPLLFERFKFVCCNRIQVIRLLVFYWMEWTSFVAWFGNMYQVKNGPCKDAWNECKPWSDCWFPVGWNVRSHCSILDGERR